MDEISKKEESFIKCYCMMKRLQTIMDRVNEDEYLKGALGLELTMTYEAFSRTLVDLRDKK